MNYLDKMKGRTQSPPRVGPGEIVLSWIGSFAGIAAVGLIHFHLLDQTGLAMIIGSFGASAVLIYGAIRSPLAQPRNLIGGHVFSAVTLHPPGGATALIAVIGGDAVHNLGYLYALVPAGSGALVMLIIALVINNMAPNRRYPEFW